MKGNAPSSYRVRTILLVAALVTGGLLWWLGHEEVPEPEVAMMREARRAESKKDPARQDGVPLGEVTAEEKTVRAKPESSRITAVTEPEQEQEATTMLSASGRVTTEAMEKLGLSEDEAEALRKIMKKVMAEAAADFASRTKEVETPAGQTSTNHYTRARDDGGQAFVDELTREFEAAVGRERSQSLIDGLGEFRYAGGMGRYHMELEVHAGGMVSYRCIDPKTAATVRTGQSSPQHFRETFGDLFGISGEGQEP